MKIATLLLMVVLISGFVAAQKQIQIKNQRFEMNAIRNGQPVHLETKNYSLSINYDTGEFFARINITESRLYTDEEMEYRIPGDEILEITGIIPINEIIDNQALKQQYVFELNVTHISTNVNVVFTFDATHIKNSNRGFTVFRVSGTVNLLDFGVKDLKGYEPEVEFLMDFQTYILGG